MSETFNAELYKRAYPDVALSGLDPKDHYERYGRLLGRDPAPKQPATPIARTPLGDIGPQPALLDLQYARGVVPSDMEIKHEDLVSIIMPSHNNEEFIVQAMNSALSQVGVKIELIVVDDGSTDGSVAMARQIAARDRRVKVISLLRNFGCYYARNIGVMNAQGRWITIIDSDDIVTTDCILRQLDALKANPEAVACVGICRRWSEDYQVPRSDPKHAENSLLWKREIIKRIGYYDTVRYGGDTEFRLRLQRAYGTPACVLKIPNEIYFLRTVANSLTSAAGGSQAHEIDGQTLRFQLSPERQKYSDSLAAWQKRNKPISATAPNSLRLEFPQTSRPFDLGSEKQNASPSLNQRRVGAMASFPPRREGLQACLASILPQLDELILYLNDYEDVPDFTRHDKIRVVRSQEARGDLRDNGKFYDLPQGDDAYIFTLDDDILYPPDYVAQMIHQIEALGRTSVVGLHGVIFPQGEFTKLQQRTVYVFNNKSAGHFVDLLGTGTTAWHSSTMKLSLPEFETKGVCDLYFAKAAADRGVPMFSIPREKNWLKVYKQFEESLFQEAMTQPKGYFDVYNRTVAPALQKGRIRRRMEAHLARGFDAEILAAAGIELRDVRAAQCRQSTLGRRTVVLQNAPTTQAGKNPPEDLHFHIVINGWNCRDYVDACLRSIAYQQPGPYSYDVTLVDDGSEDGTYEKLATSSLFPQAELVRITSNTGPAHARHIGISRISDPETIVVLVDMDDALEPHALRTVADRYYANPACLLTIGNWHDQNGTLNPQEFYSADELDGQRIREIELFNATHLRTFRRRLYDACLTSAPMGQFRMI